MVDESLAAFGHLLESLKLSTYAFNCISFSHTLKLNNSVTHNLVKRVRHVKGLVMLLDDAPSHLYSTFSVDNS